MISAALPQYVGDPVSVAPAREWFDSPQPGEQRPGLRFACTLCGNCCTGPEGYVLFSPDEAAALASHLGLSLDEFTARYTKSTVLGPSLSEVQTPNGFDCVFLDRTSIPGKAVCGVYRHRPAQCRSWPFWPRLLKSRDDWDRASRSCPGINKGNLIPPEEIRVHRARTPD